MSNVVVIGAGMMGTAISIPATENGHNISLVGTPLDRDIISSLKEKQYHPTLKRSISKRNRFFYYEELSKALENAEIVVSGVSSFGVDWFCDNVLPEISDNIPILSVTKGMVNTEDGNLLTYPDLYIKKFPAKKMTICAVGGPCTSYELADHDPSQVTFCGKDINLLRKIKEIFETSFYNISLSTDVFGVECAVALKNAFALGVTLAVGLSEKREGMSGKEHYNSQAALFGQSIKEMRGILRHFAALNNLTLSKGGAFAVEDCLYLGAGDLYVTVFGGRTRLIGTLLGRGMKFDDAIKALDGVTLESVVIAKRTAEAIKKQITLKNAAIIAADFPLLMHIDEIISQGKETKIPWKAFETETIQS